MGVLQVTEEFLRKLIDLAGNPHAREELQSDVGKLASDAQSTATDVAKDVASSGQ